MQTVSNFYKEKFGSKVYKISLDGGCTCPNRDGTLGTGGCIFCSAAGSGDFTPSRTLSISQQIIQAKQLIDKKFPKKAGEEKKYIAYFQNFTNTYGPVERLKKNWEEALKAEGVIGLALGTRPDCLSEEIIKELEIIAEKNYLQIELGLQTESEETAEYIHRGFKNQVYLDAIKKLSAIKNIHIVTHLIFGLPGETSEQFLKNTAFVCCNNKFLHDFGIKITVLYLLKDTALAKDFSEEKFKTLSEEEYFENLEQALKILPQNTVIHRLTGDPPKSILIEPKWTEDKKRIMNRVKTLLEKIIS